MKTKLIFAYAGAIVCGLVALAAALLTVLQWGNDAEFSLFGKNLDDMNTALLIVLSMAFGVGLPWLLKGLLSCALMIGHSRRESAALDKAVAKSASKQSPVPTPSDDSDI